MATLAERVASLRAGNHSDTEIHNILWTKAQEKGMDENSFNSMLKDEGINLPYVHKATVLRQPVAEQIDTDKSGLLGGENSQMSTITPMGEVKRFVGENVIEPLNQMVTGFTKAGTLGLAPVAQKEPEFEVSGGQPSPTYIAQKGGQAIGEISGNVVAGEGIGKILGVGTKMAGALAKKIPVVGKIIDQLPNLRDYTKLTRTTAREVENIPRTLQKAFGDELVVVAEKNPKATVSLTNALDNVIALGEVDPTIKLSLSKLSRDKVLKSLLNNPNVAGSLSLKDAQNITNQIVKEMPTSRLANKIKFQFDDAIASKFDDMAKVRADYGAGMDDYELLSNLENTGTNIQKIRANLVNQNIQDAAKRRLSEELTKEISKYSDIYNTLKTKRIEVLGLKTRSAAEMLQKDKLKPESKMLNFLKEVGVGSKPMKGVVAGGINEVSKGH